MPAQLDAHDHEIPASTGLEWGELWSFVLKKTSQAWIWIALFQESRQVVAYEFGDRSQSSFRRLWEAISTSKLVQATVSRIVCALLLANL
jgi:IS1 family transposase